jgi:AraC-like DNA-binding protein
MIKTILSILLLFSLSFLFSQNINQKRNLDNYLAIKEKQLSNEQINTAIVQYKDSLAYYNKVDNTFEYAYCNLIISKLYYKTGNYNSAIEYGKEALYLFQELKDTSALIYTYSSIGIIYGELDDYIIAKEYFQEVDTIAKLANKKDQLFHNNINLGIMSLNDDLYTALDYFNTAEKYFAKDKNNEKTIVSILNNKAVAYKRLGKYNKAIEVLKRVFYSIDSTHSYYVSICSNIATNYLLINKPDSSLYYINKALQNPANSLYINNYVNSYRVLTHAYIQKHEPDSSLKYYELYQHYTDSLFLRKKLAYISKLKVIYETDKLVLDVKQQQERLDKYYTRIRNLSIGIALLIIAIIAFYIYFKKLQASFRIIVKESVRTMHIEEENAKLRNKINSLEKPTDNELNKTVNSYSKEKEDKIFEEIESLFKKEKPYIDPDFNLNKLSERLHSNRTYISNIINSKTGDSFVKYINTYRVKEAKKLLIDNDNKVLTLDAIGKMAGFNASSTFNRVFKQETGVTPSFYMNNNSEY